MESMPERCPDHDRDWAHAAAMSVLRSRSMPAPRAPAPVFTPTKEISRARGWSGASLHAAMTGRAAAEDARRAQAVAAHGDGMVYRRTSAV
jgi:hypothetical protein